MCTPTDSSFPGSGAVAFPCPSQGFGWRRPASCSGFLVMGVSTGRLDRGEIVTFAAGGQRRRLSDWVFANPADMRFLIADVDAVMKGEPPRGPYEWKVKVAIAAAASLTKSASKATPRDRYEAELDAELERENDDSR